MSGRWPMGRLMCASWTAARRSGAWYLGKRGPGATLTIPIPRSGSDRRSACPFFFTCARPMRPANGKAKCTTAKMDAHMTPRSPYAAPTPCTSKAAPWVFSAAARIGPASLNPRQLLPEPGHGKRPGPAHRVDRLPPPSAHASPLPRGGPISTGWNSTAAANVQTSDSARSLPMLEVPG